MQKLAAHWTEKSTEDYLYRLASDFVRFIENAMGDTVSQGELAKRLGVTEGRVSQILNNPGNLTLKKVIEYSRALGVKVALVGYDDGDRQNLNGPIPSEIFARCWKRLGNPTDFFEFEACVAENKGLMFYDDEGTVLRVPINPSGKAATAGSGSIVAQRSAISTEVLLLTAGADCG